MEPQLLRLHRPTIRRCSRPLGRRTRPPRRDWHLRFKESRCLRHLQSKSLRRRHWLVQAQQKHRQQHPPQHLWHPPKRLQCQPQHQQHRQRPPRLARTPTPASSRGQRLRLPVTTARTSESARPPKGQLMPQLRLQHQQQRLHRLLAQAQDRQAIPTGHPQTHHRATMRARQAR